MNNTSDKITMDDQNDPLFISSLAKSFGVLELYADNQPELTVKQIREITGLTFQTIQRINNTFEHCGYLERNDRNKAYRLSKKTLDLQHKYLSTNRLVKVVWPILIELKEKTGQRCSVCILDGKDIMYLLRLQGQEFEFLTSLAGRRMPACFTAGGQIILSKMTLEERIEVLGSSELSALTPETITDKEEILKQISDCEKKGYTITYHQSLMDECAVAVPIMTPDNRILGALVISAPAVDYPPERVEREILPFMIKAARSIILP